MSGHSHFKTIKAQKELADAKRGKIFSKLGRVITIAANEKGPDPLTNSKLKTAIEQAKQFNMPRENIERAIKKGAGDLTGENLEEIFIEGFGPGGIALIIEGITDNKNRTLGEIKGILGEHDGKMAGEGAVRWMFDRKGRLYISAEGTPKEALELIAIEAGADDIRWDDSVLEVYTKPENLDAVKKTLEEKHANIESAGLIWIEKESILVNPAEREKIQTLFEALEDNDAIQDIYSNVKYSV